MVELVFRTHAVVMAADAAARREDADVAEAKLRKHVNELTRGNADAMAAVASELAGRTAAKENEAHERVARMSSRARLNAQLRGKMIGAHSRRRARGRRVGREGLRARPSTHLPHTMATSRVRCRYDRARRRRRARFDEFDCRGAMAAASGA